MTGVLIAYHTSLFSSILSRVKPRNSPWVHKNCKLSPTRSECIEDLLKKQGLESPTVLMDLYPKDLDEAMDALATNGVNLGERKKINDALKWLKTRSPSPGPR